MYSSTIIVNTIFPSGGNAELFHNSGSPNPANAKNNSPSTNQRFSMRGSGSTALFWLPLNWVGSLLVPISVPQLAQCVSLACITDEQRGQIKSSTVGLLIARSIFSRDFVVYRAGLSSLNLNLREDVLLLKKCQLFFVSWPTELLSAGIKHLGPLCGFLKRCGNSQNFWRRYLDRFSRVAKNNCILNYGFGFPIGTSS